MNPLNSLWLALAPGQPLFGNQWLALLAMLGLVALFVVAVAGVGRWLAATHPVPPPRTVAVSGISSPDTSDAVLVVITAAVHHVLGARARVAAVNVVPPSAPSVEGLMLQWSLEGRREIYTSHKLR